jgi:ornithine cyclodeaminase/alanine dehydrogenase-like protein (mu-crystallin family)
LQNKIDSFLAIQKMKGEVNANVTTNLSASIESAVRPADIICTVTSSTTPIVKGEWLKEGAHINAVGACQPQFHELDAECFRRSRVFGDSMTSCINEPGDLVTAIRDGVRLKRTGGFSQSD